MAEAPAIHDWPLPYVPRLARRDPAHVDLLVVHCTELPDLDMARSYGERELYPDSGTGASGHFYIERNGAVSRFVDPARSANHCRGYNPRSIGIELLNLGRYPDWFHTESQRMTEPYPEVQIESLLALIAMLRTDFPTLRWIAGHEDLDRAMVPSSDDPTRDVRRKLDPGPMFPWSKVLERCGLDRLPQ